MNVARHNLQEFNSERERQTVQLLEKRLARYRGSRLRFDSIGRLAGRLEADIGVARTTFLRNPRYKRRLLGYMASFRPRQAAPDDAASREELLTRLFVAKLEIAALASKNRELEKSRHQLTEFSLPARVENSSTAFANIAMALSLVLERVQESIRIDRAERSIVDYAAPPGCERVIAGPNRVGDFIAWVEQNSTSLALLAKLL